jgi:hypothetical protein
MIGRLGFGVEGLSLVTKDGVKGRGLKILCFGFRV